MKYFVFSVTTFDRLYIYI